MINYASSKKKLFFKWIKDITNSASVKKKKNMVFKEIQKILQISEK